MSAMKQDESDGRDGSDDELQPGDIVMLPDGSVAAIERIVDRDAYVVEWHKILGRGPWIFPVSELALFAILSKTLPRYRELPVSRATQIL